MSEQLPYATYVEVLERAGIGIAPAELHGGISGALSIGGLETARRWLRECREDAEARSPETTVEPLESLARATLQRLSGQELAFEPLLPDESTSLEERVAALALWCHGYLAALMGRDAALAKRLPDALREIIADFSEISRAALSRQERKQAQSEFDYLQVAEYVRAAAQLAFEELEALRSPGES